MALALLKRMDEVPKDAGRPHVSIVKSPVAVSRSAEFSTNKNPPVSPSDAPPNLLCAVEIAALPEAARPLAESIELVAVWDSFTPLERPDAPAQEADADHELVAKEPHPFSPEWTPADDSDDTRTAEEIAAEFGEQPVAETA